MKRGLVIVLDCVDFEFFGARALWSVYGQAGAHARMMGLVGSLMSRRTNCESENDMLVIDFVD